MILFPELQIFRFCGLFRTLALSQNSHEITSILRKIRDFFDSLYNGSLDWTFDGNKQLEASLKYISDTSLLLLVDNNGLFCLYRCTEFFWIDVKAEINQ